LAQATPLPPLIRTEDYATLAEAIMDLGLAMGTISKERRARFL
jgi:hypothetical protein